ncbi:hypothetical protein GCM10023339_69010 [Alloalcanivorax gelatiniphagus]
MITQKIKTKGVYTKQASGKIGKSSLKIPYRANLSTIAAKIIDPPKGD